MYLWQQEKTNNYWIIFTTNVIKDHPYNYGKIVQVLWKKITKKYFLILKVFKMMPCGFLKLNFEPLGLLPLKMILLMLK
jgi:hypothetical protein